MKPAICLLAVLLAAGAHAGELTLHLRSRVEVEGAGPADSCCVMNRQRTIAPAQTAIIICDMWDKHWSRGATERVAAMAPRMNGVVKAARDLGIFIIHAPSETMAFYKDSHARKRMSDMPRVEPPKLPATVYPRLPIDDSDGGSDTGETPWYKAWTRQHPAIEIDEARDGISDDAIEIWSALQNKRIRHVIIMGVHTNMCIINRPFAIKALAGRGMNVYLARDLTDAMYNPAMPPRVSHWQGTRLVIEYIERTFCPTILSDDIAVVPGEDAGRFIDTLPEASSAK
ncbi:MAG: isochorismatase family protein [Candidatus Hydrogenedentes bacterium]|nr:isochorismatase family protein [Candidatus Hydrogenedentota bacterium]